MLCLTACFRIISGPRNMIVLSLQLKFEAFWNVIAGYIVCCVLEDYLVCEKEATQSFEMSGTTLPVIVPHLGRL